MEVEVINLCPVAKPTWAKMCNVENADGIPVQNKEDWWYVEIHFWANVWYADPDPEDRYNAVFGAYAEDESGGGGIDFVEAQGHSFLHYTTEQPPYLDCIKVPKGEAVKSVIRTDKYAPVTEEALINALERAKGNKKVTAKLLGVHRATVFKKIKDFGLTEKYTNK